MIVLFGLLYLLLQWYGRGVKLDMTNVRHKIARDADKAGTLETRGKEHLHLFSPQR